MATDWAVTTATERIKLDSQRKASTTFTVSNPGPAADRVVFDVLPGDGAAENWFTVESPQRLVQGGASVSYVVETRVPDGVADGAYSYQAQVYSVDVPPEESSKLSGRVTFELVNPKPQPKPPWKLIAIIAAAVVVLATVAFLVFSGGGVEVPNLKDKSEADAVATLQSAGLKAGIRHKHDPSHLNLVVGQDPAAGSEVDEGSTVQFDLAVSLSAPGLVSPINNTGVLGTQMPALKWQAVPNAHHYKISVSTSNCSSTGLCTVQKNQTFESTETTFTPKMTVTGLEVRVTWSVQPIDDLGTAGPVSAQGLFRLNVIIIS